MSLELLPADKEYPNKWHVRVNYCRCHPETCCCDDWAIHKPNGDKYMTLYRKHDCQNVCDLKNKELENNE